MTGNKKGSLTIFLALAMFTFLTFCMVLMEGSRIYFFRAKAMQAMELAEFSVLSEYQQELFSQYGLFFLDLDYEQGSEHVGILEQRARIYLIKNAGELLMNGLEVQNFFRATDCGGIRFLKQAAEQMKVQSGYKLFEELVENVGNVTLEGAEIQEILEKKENTAAGILDGYLSEDGNRVLDISLPSITFPSINALTEAVFGNHSDLYSKEVMLEERILNRELNEGTVEKEKISFADMQLFHGYIFEHCNYYGAENEKVWKESLEYQLEYVISGKESDRKNLENIMWRIFLLRAGGNYLFYHQDAEHLGKARTEALALVGFTGNAALIEAVKEIFLISQAIEDGIGQTRQIFAGEKVPLYQNGLFNGIELGYEEYLYLFLNVTGAEEKTYRCMDIVEMEVRKKSGYEKFSLDHCVDCFELQWDYQFESMFVEIPLLDDEIYENRITRKIYYET